jgi:hypothetical protein
MLVSYEKRFLFIHVPKTGGTSMRAVLQKHSHQPDARPANRCLKTFGISVNHLLGNYQDYQFRTHERASVVARRLPADVFDELFKFGFVRNPWDLLPSLYKFIRKNKKHKRHRVVSGMSFPEFVAFASLKRIANQSRLISGRDGRILLDFVGKFERLADDYRIVADRLGLDVQLPHLNRTKQSDFAEYYDAATIERVRRAFRADIESFGYPTRPDVDAVVRRAA